MSTQHVSQVVGDPPVYIADFYARWNQKIEEPFYEEILQAGNQTTERSAAHPRRRRRSPTPR